MTHVEELKNDINLLPSEEREALFVALNVVPSHSHPAAPTAEEIRQRMDAIDDGEAKGVSAEEGEQRLRSIAA